MSASSLSLPIFLRINFLISYLIVTDSQNTFDWHTQRALLNDKKAGAGCTSRAFKHPGRDVTAPDVWPSILTDYTYDSELDNADGVPLASRRSSMFPEGNKWTVQNSSKITMLTNLKRQQEMTFFPAGSIITDYELIFLHSWKLKHLNDIFVFYKHTTFRFTRCWWTAVVWITCGTHSLQMIHCWANY